MSGSSVITITNSKNSDFINLHTLLTVEVIGKVLWHKAGKTMWNVMFNEEDEP